DQSRRGDAGGDLRGRDRRYEPFRGTGERLVRAARCTCDRQRGERTGPGRSGPGREANGRRGDPPPRRHGGRDCPSRPSRRRPRMTDTIGVAMLGYAFMGKAHSRALLALQHLDVPLRPELVSISGRTADRVEEARVEWGWQDAVTD